MTDWYQSIQVVEVGLYGPRKLANIGGITSVEHRSTERIFGKSLSVKTLLCVASEKHEAEPQ